MDTNGHGLAIKQRETEKVNKTSAEHFLTPWVIGKVFIVIGMLHKLSALHFGVILNFNSHPLKVYLRASEFICGSTAFSGMNGSVQLGSTVVSVALWYPAK